MPDLLSSLNPIQQEAVKATEGPVLVLAGAGSGKTRVLTHRVAYLITEKKVLPENIIVVTFTNKASGEMKERILHLTGSTAQPIMGTFHSICARLLRREGYHLGLPPGFSIYDEGDALEAIKEAMHLLAIDVKKTAPGAVRSTISGAKNENISDLEYPQFARGYFQETVAKVYIEYQKILRRNHALDFDDLMLYTIRLFQNHPEVLAKYQNQFRYILVDEYQDTNTTQYLLIKLLAHRYRNIFAVGDASQSVYSFRGADFRNIVNFQKDYPETRVFNLEQNYRSTQIILDAAHAVISPNRSHPILALWTEQKSGPKIKIHQAKNEVEEANFVIKEIKASGLPLSDFAVLYRTNAQSRSLEEAFLHSATPYTLVGGTKFYERKEIKDVLAYLRLVQNSVDSVSRKRIEKIGIKRAQKFDTLLETVVQVTNNQNFLDQTKDNVIPAQAGIQNAEDPGQARMTAAQYTTLELLDMVLETTGYLDLLNDGTEQGTARIENVKELRSVAQEFPDLTQFLENVALVQDTQFPDAKQNAPTKHAVTLMTIHASKGLEFPYVFLVGMEEGLFPHTRSLLDPNALEEERRLAYVGITRAKKQIYMLYTRSRLFFGQRSNNLVSRFVTSIPEKLIDQTTELNAAGQDYSSVDFNDDIYHDGDEEWLRG